MAPWVTAGVSDDVAEKLQMPIGPQAVEDVEGPMPFRPAVLKDPGFLDQKVLDQHSLTHFPCQPWCKVCVESQGRDSPHREQSRVTQWCHNFSLTAIWDTEAVYRLHVSSRAQTTSSQAIHATLVPDSKKMDMPTWLLEQPNWCVMWGTNASVYTETRKEFPSNHWTKLQKNVVLREKTGTFFDKCHRHRATRAMATRRRPFPQCAVFASFVMKPDPPMLL